VWPLVESTSLPQSRDTSWDLLFPIEKLGPPSMEERPLGKPHVLIPSPTNLIPFTPPRVPTTQPGQPVIVKVRLEDAPHGFRDYRNTDWVLRDMPHQIEYIEPTIFFTWPEIIWWTLSVDENDEHYWKHPYNKKVITTIVDTLRSARYINETRFRLTLSTPMVRRKGVRKRQVIKKRRRAKFVVMCINKIEQLEHLSMADRVKKIREIRDFYFADDGPGGPLSWLRDRGNPIQLLVLGTSFKEGYCIRPNDMVQQPLEEYFTYLLKRIVFKK